MVCETYSQGDSLFHRLDPRVRIAAAVGFSLLVALGKRFPVLGAGLALSIAGAVVAHLPAGAMLKRLLAVNVFLLFLWVLLPLMAGGTVLFHLGPFSYSREGAVLAGRVTLKANAIVLALTVLLGTMEISTLGHALSHLHVPDKLTHLFLFTVRYIDVLHHEYHRLVQAMRVRCFRPRMNGHTYRSVAYLVGMLLVKSLDRSERVVAAMKCRGFRGRFYVLDHFAFGRRDAVFGAASLLVLVALVWMEWL